MSTTDEQPVPPPEPLAAAPVPPEPARQAERRRRGWLLAVVAGLATVLVVAAVADHPSSAPAAEPATSQPAVAADALPPWPAPSDPLAGERAAGLTVLPSEGVVQHFHAHLDIRVDGAVVPVPANLGIDVRQQLYAELHTHADSGVIHAESASARTTFTLGQLFTEWGPRLDVTHLGGLTAASGKRLYVYVDGRPVSGDPARIRLVDRQQILLAYGATAPTDVPATFDFDAHPV